MIKTILAISIAILASASAVVAREPSPRLLKLGKGDALICDQAPYCYRFDAIVDIDSGYLRVWKTDSEGNDYVVQRLYKGNIVKVRQVFEYKGVQRAQLSIQTDNCSTFSCSGSVDLRYLR